MRAGTARRVLSFLGSLLVLLVVVAGIVFGQANGGARPTATAGRPATVAAAPGATATTPVVAAASKARPTATRPPPATAPPRAPSVPPAATDGLATVPFASLPPEAQQTIALIERGGPFPYDRDGITFGNREGLLPAQASGYYREYTVSTPGSADRGTRRIIAGRDGQLYYTDDHYESFRRVAR